MTIHRDIQHAVVTGAGGGIGSAIVAALVGAGVKVSLLGRKLESLDKVLDDIDSPQTSQAVTCDVSCRDSVDSALSSAKEKFGPINLLVNCAGMAKTKPFHKMTNTDWNDSININLNGVFNCTSAVINSMRDQGFGRIVNIASTSALKGYAYVSAYCASKHAVLGLTRALALETATKGITVNAICPGYTDTSIISDSVKVITEKTGRTAEQALHEFTKINPQQRLITPVEVANAVLWLCDEHSQSMTGQAISLSGGEVM
jgi:NAD(P)-dependent dehydrogenase (short-subunit alcohol dehydrogenase family)